jgi:hypothetical protein
MAIFANWLCKWTILIEFVVRNGFDMLWFWIMKRECDEITGQSARTEARYFQGIVRGSEGLLR